MDYDKMRETNWRNLANTVTGKNVPFMQSGRVVLIGSGHAADAVAQVRNANNRCEGSVTKVAVNLLKVSGCKIQDQEDFASEINMLQLPQYGNMVRTDIQFT